MLELTARHIPLGPNPDEPSVSAAGDYGRVVEEIDSGVGRLLAHLKALGLDEDTLVIFISDNGPWFEGVPLPDVELDGTDLSEILITSRGAVHDEILLFNNNHGVGVRTARWKLVARSYYRI